MAKAIIIAAAVLFIAGCAASPNERVVDQCMRAQLFQECLKTVPPGPQKTNYNDWDEVIDSCGNQAYYLALRPASQVAEKCKAGGGNG